MMTYSTNYNPRVATKGYRNKGFGLMETVVALAIAAVGLVALTQMSIGGLRSSTSSSNQMLANDAAVFIIERMRANSSKTAADGNYDIGGAYDCGSVTPLSCTGSGVSCSLEQIASFDVYQSMCKSQTLQRLPDGNMTLSCSDGGINANKQRAVCNVTVTWRSISDTTQTHTVTGLVL